MSTRDFMHRARVLSPDTVVSQTPRRSQRLQLKGTGSQLLQQKTECVAEPLSECDTSLVTEPSSAVRRSSRLRVSAGTEIATPSSAKEKPEPLPIPVNRSKNNHVLVNTDSDSVKVSLKLPTKQSALTQISASASELSDSSEEEGRETVSKVPQKRQKVLHKVANRDKNTRKASEDPGDPQQETKPKGKKRRTVGGNSADLAAGKGKVKAVVDTHIPLEKERSERIVRNSASKKGKGKTRGATVNR